MERNAYSLTGLYLPENKFLKKRLILISKILCLFLISCGMLIEIGWLFKSRFFQSILFDSYLISPLSSLSIVAIAANLLFEDFRQAELIKAKQVRKAIFISTTIAFSIFIVMVGLYHAGYYFKTNNIGIEKVFFNSLGTDRQAHIIIGLNIILSGIILFVARTRIKHRYHVAQFLALCILVISSTTILGGLYGLFSLSSFSHIIYMPLNVAVLFFLVSLAVFFRWPHRGFIGMFTVDSTSSNFSIQLLFLKIFSIAAIGLASLLGARINIYNYHESIAVFAILTMVLSTCFAWLNTKLVYKIELERFLMQEELKIHNIGLSLGNEDLASRIDELREEHKSVVDKLNNKEKYKAVIENLE